MAQIVTWVVNRITKQRARSEPPDTVDYIGACAMVEAYIGPVLREMPERARVGVAHVFVEDFAKITGAKVGEYEYNRKLLQAWIETNAARFLVKYRTEMR